MLNIKGILNLKMTDFKTLEEYEEFVTRDENWDNLHNLKVEENNPNGKNHVKSSYIYENWDEIWVYNGYLVARISKGSDKVVMNPDFTRYLLENTSNYIDLYKEEKEKEEFEISKNLDMDSILDRINEVGFENLTEIEKRFLKNNN
jgi:hypothetical protein